MFAPNITREELLHSHTATRLKIDNEPTSEHEKNLVRVSWFLQSLREKLQKKYPDARITIRISSGYRCKKLNAEIGGSKTSAHMKGLAADITCTFLSNKQLAEFIRDNMVEEGYDQVILEFGRWVHVGLTEGQPRLQALTSKMVDGKTKYEVGIND